MPDPLNTRNGGFDAAAERFDDDERGNVVLAMMRARVWSQMSAAFPNGGRLLELGSGTGTDASRLAREKGCRIALLDVAPTLLARAAEKVQSRAPGHLVGTHVLPAREVGKLVDCYGAASFDGAYSNFGALNCEGNLEVVADGLATLLRPGAGLVLSIINRWCPPEVVWYLTHREWSEAVRRFGGPVQAAAYPGGPKDVKTWYYSRRDVERAFGANFQMEWTEALPLVWPPPYLDFLVTRHPRVFGALERLEKIAAPLPILRDLGDHFLLRLTRKHS